MKDTPTEE